MIDNLSGDVQANLIATGVATVIGAAAGLSREAALRLGFSRRLWRTIKSRDVSVVTSTTIKDVQPGHVRLATGSGQVRALSYLNRAFYRAFPRCAMDQVYMSEETHDEVLRRHLIVVGGPHTNALTARILKEYAATLKLSIGPDNSIVIGDQSFSPEMDNGRLSCDIGVIIACPNPWREKKRAIVFFGSHTFGTEGAAMFFSQTAGFNSPLRGMHYIVVVRSVIGASAVTRNEKLFALPLDFSGGVAASA